MLLKRHYSVVIFAPVSFFMASTAVQAAGFIEDSEATLNLRNFYMDRDIKGNSSSNWSGHGGEQSTLRGWSQSAILDMKSGYTEGRIGI